VIEDVTHVAQATFWTSGPLSVLNLASATVRGDTAFVIRRLALEHVDRLDVGVWPAVRTLDSMASMSHSHQQADFAIGVHDVVEMACITAYGPSASSRDRSRAACAAPPDRVVAVTHVTTKSRPTNTMISPVSTIAGQRHRFVGHVVRPS